MGFNSPEHLANLFRVLAEPEGLTEKQVNLRVNFEIVLHVS